jgi:uracil-DNA glycosylase
LESCRSWLEDELRLIRPTLLIPVGKVAIGYFLGEHPLHETIGKVHHAAHAGGTSLVIPLPHPSGASSWIHVARHRALVERALAFIADEMGGATPALHAATDAA